MAFINGNLVPFGILFSNVNDTVLGELETAEAPKAITITDIGNYYLQSDQFIADLQGLWDWDDPETLTWGCFSIVRSGNNTVGIQDSYTATVNTYGGAMRVSEGGQTPTDVYIVKSDKALLIDMSGGSVILFSAKDSNGTERKCVAIGRNDSTYNYCVAADDGTDAHVYRISNSGNRRLTTSVYELTPFFDELASDFVKDDNVLIVRSLPAKANGLYKIGENRFYFGNYIALKDW